MDEACNESHKTFVISTTAFKSTKLYKENVSYGRPQYTRKVGGRGSAMAGADGLLNQKAIEYFISLPGEKLIFAKRKHWFVLVSQLCTTIAISLLLALVAVFLFLLFAYPTLAITSVFVIFTITFSILAKLFVDWYCQVYVVTTRRIFEVCYSPLFSDQINDVLLDQVRCTEVDVKRNGIINELIDMGDVVVAFDRPTHQQEFMLLNIKDPKGTGILLADVLDSLKPAGSMSTWYRIHDRPNQYRFTEEIFPGQSVGIA